jgi:tetratricopeptide (TPR) repeat protein
MMRSRAFGLFLLFATLLIFLPASFAQFLNFDDPEYVSENPVVSQGLSWYGLKWAFASAHAANWHPLTWLSHMLDCDLFLLNPAGHHLVNILFHAANAALQFGLILRLTNPLPAADEPAGEPRNIWPAALVAALFAWHPLHVESVAWISERKDVLSTFFTLLTLLCYAQYARGRTQARTGPSQGGVRGMDRDYVLAVICFALALLSKSMPVTLPLVMLLLDFWPLNRGNAGPERFAVARQLVLEKVPFLACSGIVCVITIWSQHHAESSFTNIPIGIRLENVVTGYVAYLGKMIWPLHLAAFYPYHPNIPLVFVLECALLLGAISWLTWLERHSSPYLLVGWLWFLITLLPVIGLIQVGSQSIADRYTYFPLVGIFLGGAFALQALARKFPGSERALVAVGMAVLVGCVCLTERQLGYWTNSEVLFRHAIEVEDSATARIDLGSTLEENNDLEKALAQFLIAWRLQPDNSMADINIGGILAMRGNLELSAVYYEHAAAQNPWNYLFYENYGRELVTLKRYPEAAKAFTRAIEIDPHVATPHFLMARLLLKEGNNQAALGELDQAMKLEPQNLETILFDVSVLAASDDARIRDGARAKALARSVVEATHGQQAAALDALAMSSAELGLYPDAELYESQAMQVASAANQVEGFGLLKKHLAAFQNHQPWRESFKSN